VDDAVAPVAEAVEVMAIAEEAAAVAFLTTTSEGAGSPTLDPFVVVHSLVPTSLY
jgi:hypothetical protein